MWWVTPVVPKAVLSHYNGIILYVQQSANDMIDYIILVTPPSGVYIKQPSSGTAFCLMCTPAQQ